MRKEAKQSKHVTVAHVSAYHGGVWHGEQYAFQGFKQNKYFTSDRFIKLDENFQRPDGQPLCGVGVEIETECSTIKDDDVLAEVFASVIFAHFPEDLFKMQHDGSLSGSSSAECITQVMTKAFVRNHYRDFKLMYDTYFPALGISCGSGNCGMHVNISNAMFGKTKAKQDKAIRKLYYFVNKHFALCCKLFQRTGSTHYCSQMQYDNAKTLDLEGFGSNHGVCFNLGHYRTGRIELRLVGGQKSFGSFRNTMESVFFLVDRVQKLKWDDLDNLATVFQGCNQYVYDRLKTKCSLPQDTLDAIRDSIIREELL